MRELYEKYYTARLWWQPDERVTPEIIDVEGEYDTEEEATIIARERLPLAFGCLRDDDGGTPNGPTFPRGSASPARRPAKSRRAGLSGRCSCAMELESLRRIGQKTPRIGGTPFLRGARISQ